MRGVVISSKSSGSFVLTKIDVPEAGVRKCCYQIYFVSVKGIGHKIRLKWYRFSGFRKRGNCGGQPQKAWPRYR
jgi:hypothetical protein